MQVGRGKSDLDLAAALEFIDVIGYNSAFQQLRTKEQLGYTVYTQLERGPPGLVTPPGEDYDFEDGDGWGGPHPGGPLAWSIVVQSPDKSPAEIEERVEAWIAAFRGELADMPDDIFEATVASMVSISVMICCCPSAIVVVVVGVDDDVFVVQEEVGAGEGRGEGTEFHVHCTCPKITIDRDESDASTLICTRVESGNLHIFAMRDTPPPLPQ